MSGDRFERLAQDRADLLANSRAQVRAPINGMETYEEVVDSNFGIAFRFAYLVPKGYPVVAPLVYCLEPEVPRLIDLHVYLNGSLCLYEPGEWHSGLTLLDVRNWACEWVFNVVPRLSIGEDWMSPEHRP